MEKIKVVIFDLDGTIADTLPLCIASFRKSIEPLICKRLSDKEIVANFGPSEEGTIMALAPSHYSRGIISYLHYYYRLHEMCPGVFSGIINLLDELKRKNVHIAMVTGKGVNSTNISLEMFGVASYFEIIQTGSPAGPCKKEGIEAVVNHFEGIAKSEMVYVGDAPSDITASRAAGIPVVSAAWAKSSEADSLRQLNPDYLFSTIDEFRSWLLKWV